MTMHVSRWLSNQNATGRSRPGAWPGVGCYVGASLAVGFAFAVLDGIVNANPLAQASYAVFAPLARPGFDVITGVTIDLASGFISSGHLSSAVPRFARSTRVWHSDSLCGSCAW